MHQDAVMRRIACWVSGCQRRDGDVTWRRWRRAGCSGSKQLVWMTHSRCSPSSASLRRPALGHAAAVINNLSPGTVVAGAARRLADRRGLHWEGRTRRSINERPPSRPPRHRRYRLSRFTVTIRFVCIVNFSSHQINGRFYRHGWLLEVLMYK